MRLVLISLNMLKASDHCSTFWRRVITRYRVVLKNYESGVCFEQESSILQPYQSGKALGKLSGKMSGTG